MADARAWRQEMQVAVRRGHAGAPSAATVRSAALEWLELARSGVARTRSGDPYKPSAIRSYETSLHALLPEIGHLRLSALTRNHLQDIVDRLVAAGRAPSTVRNTILPLRAIYRRAGADVAFWPRDDIPPLQASAVAHVQRLVAAPRRRLERGVELWSTTEWPREYVLPDQLVQVLGNRERVLAHLDWDTFGQPLNVPQAVAVDDVGVLGAVEDDGYGNARLSHSQRSA